MSTARRATGARNESLQSAAQRIYDAAGRNTKTAADALILEIRKRPTEPSATQKNDCFGCFIRNGGAAWRSQKA